MYYIRIGRKPNTGAGVVMGAEVVLGAEVRVMPGWHLVPVR